MTPARRETLRITLSMAVVCALGALVLGVLYAATDRYHRAATQRTEREAIFTLLGLDSAAHVTEVRQYLAPARRIVLYRAAPLGREEETREIAFSLDGALTSRPGTEAAAARRDPLIPIGRLFVARDGGGRAGFVIEGSARGYKNRIRFLVGLSSDFAITGVRVLEHEEDPGLGAEVATPAFQGQFLGRDPAVLAGLEVTRDPMPEDWRAALAELRRMPAAPWRERHRALVARERSRPIYAVTGATISSRALTDGVRVTVEHFRRRWELLAPHLEGAS